MYYHECPVCHCNLDPGERCDCEREEEEDEPHLSRKGLHTHTERLPGSGRRRPAVWSRRLCCREKTKSGYRKYVEVCRPVEFGSMRKAHADGANIDEGTGK